MAEHFALTADERLQRIPSGASTLVGNRAGWAMTFLTKGALIAKVAPKTYRATDAGVEFLAAHPHHVTVKDLETMEGWDNAWRATKPKPLMLRHHVGARVERMIEVLDLDHNYFEDGE
jgi:restriction system protein